MVVGGSPLPIDSASRLPSLAPVVPVGIPVYVPATAYSDGDRHAGMVVRAPCVQRFRTPGRVMSKRMTERRKSRIV